MGCSITRPDPQVLFDRYKTMFSANVLGGSPVIPESNEWYVVAMDYAAAEEFFSISEQSWKERDPRYACCDNLYDLASVDGMYPKSAGFAQGYVQITGIPGSQLIPGLQVAFNDAIYQSSGAVPLVLPVSGSTVIRVRSVVAGSAGNIAGSQNVTGTLQSQLVGVDRVVTLFGGQLCGGSESETCEEFRSRYLKRKQYQPRATDAWIRTKLLEWPCATRVCQRGEACCSQSDDCGCSDCGGKLQYHVLFDGTFECGVAPQCVIDEINLWMFGDPQGYGLGETEAGVCGLVYPVTAATVNILIDGISCITPAQEQEIQDQVEDLFRNVCPSGTLYKRQVETLIAQIVGSATSFDVVMTSASPNVSLTACGDIDSKCDILPCLGTLTYAYRQSGLDGCS